MSTDQKIEDLNVSEADAEAVKGGLRKSFEDITKELESKDKLGNFEIQQLSSR